MYLVQRRLEGVGKIIRVYNVMRVAKVGQSKDEKVNLIFWPIEGFGTFLSSNLNLTCILTRDMST